VRTSLFVLLLIAAATSAHAQPRAASLFVEGALLGDFDSSQRRSDFEPPRPASAGGSGAIGFQAGHFTARFEAEVPAFHSSTFTETYAGLKRFDVASFRTITYGALFGGRFQPYRKVELAALAGFSDAIQEDRFSGYDETLLPNGAVVRNDISSRSSYRGGGFIAGADAAVRMTPHLSLVPELRFLVYNEYGSVFRPGLAIRWTF
jgi:hypothetical protein